MGLFEIFSNHSGFFIQEFVHLLVGVSLGLIVSKITKSKQALLKRFISQAMLMTVAVSLLIDTDHLVDYITAFGLNFNLTSVLSAEYFKVNGQLFVPLHSWELAVFLGLLGLKAKKRKYQIPLISLAVGIFGHILVDQIMNSPAHQGMYFLTLRFLHGFIDPKFW